MNTTAHNPKIHRNSFSIRAGLFTLSIFLLFRPMTVSFHHIGEISLLDIFGLASSFLIIIGLLFNLHRIRLDLTSILILFFVFYCIISIAWGSEHRDIARMTLPFLPYFLAITVVHNEQSCFRLIKLTMIAFSIPIVGSVAMIITGMSDTLVTGSMIERQSGLSSGVHTLGHLMLFYSFIYGLYLLLQRKKSTLFKWIMLAFLIGSFFCIYKTYTRTVYLGSAIFWLTYLFYLRRKYFYIAIIALTPIMIYKSEDAWNMLTQQKAYSKTISKDKVDVNKASSGRLTIWEHNLDLYSRLPFTTKLSGVGLGNELKPVPGMIGKQWIGSHNDYLSLLIMTGATGLLFYLLIYASLFFTIVRTSKNTKQKVFYLAVLASVLVMNFVSNSYIVRFQMGQLFWFLMGLFYANNKITKPSLTTKTYSYKQQY